MYYLFCDVLYFCTNIVQSCLISEFKGSWSVLYIVDHFSWTYITTKWDQITALLILSAHLSWRTLSMKLRNPRLLVFSRSVICRNKTTVFNSCVFLGLESLHLLSHLILKPSHSEHIIHTHYHQSPLHLRLSFSTCSLCASYSISVTLSLTLLCQW